MKNIIVLAGHFGSGKTNLAASLALEAAEKGPVFLVDIDIVNPMFRANDLKSVFEGTNVALVAPEFANTNVEAFGLPREAGAVIKTPGSRAIFDVGGDDGGAVALGRYRRDLEKAGYDMLFVYNRFRPFTAEPEAALAMLRAIEAVSGLGFTGIASNHNVGRHTTEADVESSRSHTAALSALAGVPVALEAFARGLSPDIPKETAYPFDVLLSRSFEY